MEGLKIDELKYLPYEINQTKNCIGILVSNLLLINVLKGFFMFKNDVSQTYNLQDATFEIIIMLAGAFLLGYLLSWLINKLISEKRKQLQFSAEKHPIQKVNNANTSLGTTSNPRIVRNNLATESTYRTPKIDDLSKITGIDGDIQFALKKQGINSFIDLRDIKRQTLLTIQEDIPKLNKKETETWPHQASLAAKGEWKKLDEYQAFIERAQVASQNTLQQKPANADDLTVVEGIGPKIEDILNKNGIYTFNQLSNSDSMMLKKLIVDADIRFENNETESWPHQAAMAEKGQWEELNIYQEFMHSESIIDTGMESEPSPKSLQNDIDITDEVMNLNDHDDLKKVEGIGPKIEEILNKSGIYTFKQLYNSDSNRLKKLLDDEGNQFKMHNPQSWPHQAGMAHRGEWEELKKYQELMDGGREVHSIDASSNITKISDNVTSKSSAKDDLKKIEGIGPKIEELLNSHGIHSYHDLAISSREIIKQYLDDAGPQYRVHEPETWPQQAKLASEASWDELERYQDSIIDGHK